jgi:hypothetical protein
MMRIMNHKRKRRVMLRKLTRIRKLNPRRKGIRIFRMGGNSLTCKPILLCKLKEIIKERYVFYHKSLTNVWEDYLDIKHFYIKVQLKFKANFFVPKRTSFISNSQYQPFHDILTSKELRFPQKALEELCPNYMDIRRILLC